MALFITWSMTCQMHINLPTKFSPKFPSRALRSWSLTIKARATPPQGHPPPPPPRRNDDRCSTRTHSTTAPATTYARSRHGSRHIGPRPTPSAYPFGTHPKPLRMFAESEREPTPTTRTDSASWTPPATRHGLGLADDATHPPRPTRAQCVAVRSGTPHPPQRDAAPPPPPGHRPRPPHRRDATAATLQAATTTPRPPPRRRHRRQGRRHSTATPTAAPRLAIATDRR